MLLDNGVNGNDAKDEKSLYRFIRRHSYYQSWAKWHKTVQKHEVAILSETLHIWL